MNVKIIKIKKSGTMPPELKKKVLISTGFLIHLTGKLKCLTKVGFVNRKMKFVLLVTWVVKLSC